MELKINEMIFIFVFFSIVGWILESAYRSLSERRLINPGLIAGPYLPLYGFGAILLTVVRDNIPNRPFLFVIFTVLSYFPAHDQMTLLQPLLLAFNIAAKGIAYIIVATLLEFVSGWFLEHVFSIRLWDYGDQRWSVRGYVCLKFSLYWVFLAFVLEYFLFPGALRIYRTSEVTMTVLSLIIVEIITIDFLIKGKRIFDTAKSKRENETMIEEREFAEITAPLLGNPLVSSLGNYSHHYLRTRLEHSLDVAWLSFRIARRLHLDTRAIVRGALLHDLFHYDWLREGPRWHGFRHPRIALENAKKVIPLTKKEENIIIRHMWPLTIVPPLYPEAWVVSAVDKYCGAKDYLIGIVATLKRAVPDRIVHFLR